MDSPQRADPLIAVILLKFTDKDGKLSFFIAEVTLFFLFVQKLKTCIYIFMTSDLLWSCVNNNRCFLEAEAEVSTMLLLIMTLIRSTIKNHRDMVGVDGWGYKGVSDLNIGDHGLHPVSYQY